MNKQQKNIAYSKSLLILFCVVLFFGAVTYLIASIFVYILSPIYPKIRKVLSHCFCKLFKMCFAVQPGLCYQFGIKLPETDRKILLIANHRSNLDVFSFLAQVPGLRVVANDKPFKLPFLGILLRLRKQIHLKGAGLDSLNQGIKEMKDGISKGDPILFFPELTRCTKGTIGTGKFLLLPFTLAVSEDALIIPLVVSKTDYVWPKNIIGLNYNSPFKSYSLDYIDTRNFKTSRELAKECKKVIDEALLKDGY